MSEPHASSTPSLSELPTDELVAYGSELGLHVDDRTPRGELLRRIRDRQALLVELDREALLDIAAWARLPVRRSATKEALAKKIASVTKYHYEGLSDRGLRALARLHGAEVRTSDSRETIERRLKRRAGLWARLRRRRRSVVGGWISNLLEHDNPEGEYRFLPEEDGNKPTLRDSIEESGLVGGIAQRLRGAADQYVYEKLDEIERRIDHKLDEIDARLGEWRNQEISNRLRLIRITIISAIIVAVISLGYDYLKSRYGSAAGPERPSADVVKTPEGAE